MAHLLLVDDYPGLCPVMQAALEELPSCRITAAASGAAPSISNDGRSTPCRRADVDYLRDKARAFRRLATQHDVKNLPQISEIADELEAKAAEIERRHDPRKTN